VAVGGVRAAVCRTGRIDAADEKNTQEDETHEILLWMRDPAHWTDALALTLAS